MSIEKNEGFVSIQESWRKTLATVRYIITQLADELVEIVARGVMLLAPLPNAISLYNITMHQMGMGWLAALAFAATIEFVIFFLIEVALLMLSRWLQGKGTAYQYAFAFMTVVVMLSTGIVINYVWVLETHKVMAWMPVLSLCSFIAIGLKRWDARNMEKGVKPVKSSVKSGVKFTSDDFTPSVKSDFTERQQTILRLLTPLSGQDVKSLNKSELARKIGVSRPTLNSDLDALQATGAINLNGHVIVN